MHWLYNIFSFYLDLYEVIGGLWVSITPNWMNVYKSMILSIIELARKWTKFLKSIMRNMSHVLLFLYGVYSYTVVKILLSLLTDALFCAQYWCYILLEVLIICFSLCALSFSCFLTFSSCCFWPITQQLQDTTKNQSFARAHKLGLEKIMTPIFSLGDVSGVLHAMHRP